MGMVSIYRAYGKGATWDQIFVKSDSTEVSGENLAGEMASGEDLTGLYDQQTKVLDLEFKVM